MFKKYFFGALLVATTSLNANNLYDKYKPSNEFLQFFKNCNQVLDNYYYLNCYNYKLKSSIALAYKLDEKYLKTHIKKRPKFESDYRIPKRYRTNWSDYLHSGYDRGHILSNQSMNATTNAQRSTFLMSNVVPQLPEINRKLMLKLERYERLLANNLKSIEILSLIFFDGKKYIKNGIAVPNEFFRMFKGNNFKKCFVIPNKDIDTNTPLKHFEVNCNLYIKKFLGVNYEK
ncbi:DNA/RNA non-specific endonuclease [Campylobacter sp. MG1]|uniref:DNA/RNA non-specific endonuclease n=1 Tax=Campylobacter sp. MG1 TaxID=2976332 RepID=UPI00226CE844|nr:DNA/RNA non-specific endonuclease [Campylobacter sp. MG1]